MECPSRVVFPWEVAQQRGATFQKRFILHVGDNTHFRRLSHGTLSFNIEEANALNLVVKELYPVGWSLEKEKISTMPPRTENWPG